MWEKGEKLIIKDKFAAPIHGAILFAVGLFFVCFCAYNLIEIHNGNEDVLGNQIGVSALLIGFVLGCVAIYFTFFPPKKTIIIDKEGIKIEKEKVFYPWNMVYMAYPGGREMNQDDGEIKNLKGSNERRVYCLHVLYKEGEKTIHNMHKLSTYAVYDPDEISAAIKYWSGRDIGEKEDYEREKYIEQQTKNGMSEDDAEKSRERINAAMPIFQEAQDSVVTSLIFSIILLPIGAGVMMKLILWGADDSIEIEYQIAALLVSVTTAILMLFKIIGTKKNKGIEKIKQTEEAKALSNDEFEKCLQIAKLNGSNGQTAINILLGICAAIALYLALAIYKMI